MFIALICLAVLQYLSACSTAPLPAPASYEDACDHYEAQLWEFHRSNDRAPWRPNRDKQYYNLLQCSIFYMAQKGDYSSATETILIHVTAPGKTQEFWDHYMEDHPDNKPANRRTVVLTESESTDSFAYFRGVTEWRHWPSDPDTLRRADIRGYYRKLRFGLVEFTFGYMAPAEKYREQYPSRSTLEFFHSLQ